MDIIYCTFNCFTFIYDFALSTCDTECRATSKASKSSNTRQKHSSSLVENYYRSYVQTGSVLVGAARLEIGQRQKYGRVAHRYGHLFCRASFGGSVFELYKANQFCL